MLRPDRGIERVYLHRAPVDMRKQIDGLAILARDVIQQDPLQGAMFAFINARRNKLTSSNLTRHNVAETEQGF